MNTPIAPYSKLRKLYGHIVSWREKPNQFPDIENKTRPLMLFAILYQARYDALRNR
jgi:hypothetical protein